MNEDEIKKKLNEGYIRTIILFEVIGNPKTHVEEALHNHVKKLESDEQLIILQKDIAEAEEQENYWSTFAEVEMLVKKLDKFTWLCLNFMPASVEIMAPEELKFKAGNLTNWLNDLLAKSHEISALSQQIGQQNKLMLKNMNALIRNAVLLCIDSDITSPKEISSRIGISEKDLAPVFEAMIKEEKIKKEGKVYIRK